MHVVRAKNAKHANAFYAQQSSSAVAASITIVFKCRQTSGEKSGRWIIGRHHACHTVILLKFNKAFQNQISSFFFDKLSHVIDYFYL